jgi:predicted DsbA family dithiol-disulfide isomerase
MLVEVWQDTVCPWCRIGERHLQLALEQWQGAPVEVRYRSFFLDPTIPVEGREFGAAMAQKGGGQIPLEGFFAEPRRRGEAVGLKFNFEQITWMPNTMLSHRLVALAPEDRREAVLRAVYAAFFEHERDIGRVDTLLDIAAAEGLDRDAMAEHLATDAGKAEVLADVREAQELGISGVPFFVFGRRYALSGAQPPETILAALKRTSDDLAAGK